jgi:hypothetical protein
VTETFETGLRVRLVCHRFEFAAVCPSFQDDRPLMEAARACKQDHLQTRRLALATQSQACFARANAASLLVIRTLD